MKEPSCLDKCGKSKLYTYEEVAKHNKQNDAWVTYKDTVYDISKFIENHPGGTDKIMLSVGKGIDKYWDIYQQHTNNPDIFKATASSLLLHSLLL